MAGERVISPDHPSYNDASCTTAAAGRTSLAIQCLMKNVLFVCSRNKLRSPTAEEVFATWPGVEVASAGLSNDAETPITIELVRWADLVFVMEKAHRQKLSARFRAHLRGKRVICLDIADDYAFMDPELIKILKVRVTKFLTAA
jgi:predicted protein tyrosine phosphatase